MPWKNYEHKCFECGGMGEVQCGCCDSEVECETCEGEGIDPEKVDLAKFREVAKTAFANGGVYAKPGDTGSWEIVENGVWVGRTDGRVRVYYRDFLQPQPEPVKAETSPHPS